MKKTITKLIKPGLMINTHGVHGHFYDEKHKTPLFNPCILVKITSHTTSIRKYWDCWFFDVLSQKYNRWSYSNVYNVLKCGDNFLLSKPNDG